MSRKNQRDNFLNAAGWGKAKPTELAADASFRRYYRLKLGGQARVLMDAPPTHESVNEFISISNHLRAMGLNAPKILNEDRENGFLLREDFGDKKLFCLFQFNSCHFVIFCFLNEIYLRNTIINVRGVTKKIYQLHLSIQNMESMPMQYQPLK